ncbi:hypothetical protein JZ751_002547 [Albula glossodonta]|uniref:Coiled-coil domain-containing protein 170 n=1 Tax=Albula glossodonta TaxID=121402 RepID=A0A8T2NA44_9TELE|nr:hypothetical protein JZ751_002547 [Albula glossodonta]
MERETTCLASAKARLDTTLQALANENRELKGQIRDLESQSQEHLTEWNKTKQEASDTKRTYQEFVSKLTVRLGMDLSGREDPQDVIVSQVGVVSQRSKGQTEKICTLEENVAALEVESRASRETVMRLVAEVNRERAEASTHAREAESLRQEVNSVLLAKRSAEQENQSLLERVQASQRALAACRQELSGVEQHSRELDSNLHGSQMEAQALLAREKAFREEVAALLGAQCATAPPTEEDLRQRLRELCSREKNGREALLEMEAKASRLSEKLTEQEELHQGALQRAQQAEQRGRELCGKLRGLETELLSGEVVRDGLRHSRQHYECFLEQLSEKMKLARVTADLGFDMRLEAVLSRAEQLVRQEGVALVESRTLAHSLQRKLKAQKEKLESKELHTDLLRRKVAQLEEEKRGRSTLAVERDDAHLAARKLQKKVERLQEELVSLRRSNTELKVQLADTHELKIKVMEQDQTITEQGKSLNELEKGKQKAEKRLSTAKSELQSRASRAVEEQQQALLLLDSHSNELRTLRQTVAELSKSEKQVSIGADPPGREGAALAHLADFRKVVSEMLGMDISALAIPDYEIIKRLEWVLNPYRYHQHHPHPPPHHHHHCSSLSQPQPQEKQPSGPTSTEHAPITGLKALPSPAESTQ